MIKLAVLIIICLSGIFFLWGDTLEGKFTSTLVVSFIIFSVFLYFQVIQLSGRYKTKNNVFTLLFSLWIIIWTVLRLLFLVYYAIEVGWYLSLILIGIAYIASYIAAYIGTFLFKNDSYTVIGSIGLLGIPVSLYFLYISSPIEIEQIEQLLNSIGIK